MSTIRAIKAREVLDGRGFPTLEVILWIQDGRSVIVNVPTQINTQFPQAVVLRDNDQQEFNGQGVKQAVQNVNQVIGPQLRGMTTTQQGQVDQALIQIDGTNNKARLGANAVLGVSMAVLKAGALSVGLSLYSYIQQKYQLTDYFKFPACIYDLINGGDFGNDNLDLQEFSVIPASHIKFPHSIAMASTLKQKLRAVIESKGGSVCSGPLGGFLPRMNSNQDVFELILEAIKITDYTFAQDLFFGLNAAAPNLNTDHKYQLRDKPNPYSGQEFFNFYQQIRSMYKTIYLEDPFASHDTKFWHKLTTELGDTTRITANSLVQGDLNQLQQAINKQWANTLVLNLLTRGTISEIVQLAKVAQDNQWQVVVAHNPGETTDSFLADFAVGIGADYVKFGPPNRGEHIAKYNRLIRIYEELQQ